ncbi:MAG: hypothetical protein JWM68_888, partial [Verrucomicrobiales bacterium]|nr:hypothetical protein [Verrucomicrobiales bacterium]
GGIAEEKFLKVEGRATKSIFFPEKFLFWSLEPRK